MGENSTNLVTLKESENDSAQMFQTGDKSACLD
jgi:hypothetical protein